MTTKQFSKHIELIKESLKSNGWAQDRWGHFRKSQLGKEYRIKFQSISIRYEVQVVLHDNSKDWVNLRSDYLKNVSVEGKYIKIKGVLI